VERETDFQSAGEQPRDRYDVVVLGGGLAGLTLGRQLKRARPETSVLVAEKRQGPAPDAAFKVGESTVEISAHYFAEVVGMKDHLDNEQLRKSGLRYFFPGNGNHDIAARYEWGPTDFAPAPSYQLDRGRFENALWKANLESGVDVFDGCWVDDVDLGDDEHVVTIVQGGPGGERTAVAARWVVDATGRASTLKRKLGLAKEAEHTINSAWLRLGGGIDIDDWSTDPDWLGRMVRPGVRVASTNHLLGEGYWVWLIPLVSGPISIGIVADPRFHRWERMNTLEATLDWFHEHEPQLGAVIAERRDRIEDFLRIENFAFSCERVYSPQRWCLTGEAGAFADPLYSPGSDFIAVGNTFITDLVTRDLNGEDVGQRLEFFNGHFLQLFDAYLGVYTNLYPVFGNQSVMAFKLLWDFSVYWSITALRFLNGKLTDMQFTQAALPHLLTVFQLTARMQDLFKEWHRLAPAEPRPGLVATNNISIVHEKHCALDAPVEDDEKLLAMFAENAEFVRALAVLIFHQALRSLPDATIDEATKINPAAIGLDARRWEEDGLFDDAGLSLARARELAPGVEASWIDQTFVAR
jgi:flavin-dependent dehydrogenase